MSATIVFVVTLLGVEAVFVVVVDAIVVGSIAIEIDSKDSKFALTGVELLFILAVGLTFISEACCIFSKRRGSGSIRHSSWYNKVGLVDEKKNANSQNKRHTLETQQLCVQQYIFLQQEIQRNRFSLKT
jgi:hypothetical protein